MEHRCKESNGVPFTVEDVGWGWQLYTIGKTNSTNVTPLNFCPYCGMRLSCDDCEFYVDYKEAGKMCRLGYKFGTPECWKVKRVKGAKG